MIDIQRLATDAAYWDECDPSGGEATHYCPGDAFHPEGWLKGSKNHAHFMFAGGGSWYSGFKIESNYIPRPQKPEVEWDGEGPDAYACPAHCGCLWRDNGDETMSLYGPNSKSCSICEPMTLDELTPVSFKDMDGDKILNIPYRRLAPVTDHAAIRYSGEWRGQGCPSPGEDCEVKVGEWKPCRVIGFDCPFICVSIYGSGYYAAMKSELRPIRTKTQRDRDELVGFIKSVDDGTQEFSPYDVADAILSRYNLEPKDA